MKKSEPRKLKPKAKPSNTAKAITLPPARAQVRTLGNGLEVLVQEDHSHPLVSVQVWVRAGSVCEEAWTGAGLAHLVEHMLFKGTQKRAAQQISQDIQAMGGQVNAYTSFNRTVYWIDGLSEHAEGYLEVLGDMVQNSKLDADELAREMDVIRREMAMDNDDPNSAAQHLVQSTSFRLHPLRHPVIGYREVFDQVTQADVADFVGRHYVPNNCFVVVTGDVDASSIFILAEKHLGAWKRRPYPPVLLPLEPRQQGVRRNSRTFPSELTRLSFGWHIPGEAHEDKGALDVLGFLLGGGRSSRLFQELREKRGIVHDVGAGAWATQECGLFSVDVECDPGDAAEAEKAMAEVIERMRAKGPTHAELSKAVRSSLSGQLRALATTRGQAASLGHGWLTAGSLQFGALYLTAVEQLTPAKIKEVAQKYLDAARVNIVVVEPESAAHRPQAVTVAAKCETLVRTVLPNGLTLIVGENPKLPLVSLRLQFLAGVPFESDKNAGVTQITAQLMMKGTRKRTAEELAHVLEACGGSIRTQGDAHRLTLASDVIRGDETLGLDLLADLAMNAKLPAAQLAQIKKRQIAAIREEQEDPLTVAMRLCRKKIFAGAPYERTALGTEETMSRLTAEDCRLTLKSQVCAANGVISVYGDVKANEIKKTVLRVFAKLPKGHRDSAARRIFDSRGNAGQWEQRMEKEQAVLVIGFPTVGQQDADSYALTLIDEACSDMGSRLFNRLREELGLAYYVGAQSFAALGAGAFYFYIGTDPQKLVLAEKEMLNQIADLAAHGLTADEISRAKTTWRSSWLRMQQGNGALADGAGWDELNGRGYRHLERLPAIMESLTNADIQRVAAKFLDVSNAFIVRVMPR
jgi:zinc protease